MTRKKKLQKFRNVTKKKPEENPHCEYIKQLTIQQNNHAPKLNTKFNVFVRKS